MGVQQTGDRLPTLICSVSKMPGVRFANTFAQRNRPCASHTQCQNRTLRSGRRRPQPDTTVEPVELPEDSPPAPRRQLVDPRGCAQRRPVRHPGQSVRQPDQWSRRSRRLRRYRPAGGRVGQTVNARVVSAPVHHQARIVRRVAAHVPPLDAAFVVLRYVLVRLDRDGKCQAAGPHWPVAHLSTSLRMALGLQFSNRECSAAGCGSDCNRSYAVGWRVYLGKAR